MTKVISGEIVNKGEVEEEKRIAEVCKRAGLTEDLTAGVIVEGLKSTTVLVNKQTGEPCGEVPNHTVRAKFIEVAVEILGMKKGDSPAQKCPQLHFHLPPGFKFND